MLTASALVRYSHLDRRLCLAPRRGPGRDGMAAEHQHERYVLSAVAAEAWRGSRQAAPRLEVVEAAPGRFVSKAFSITGRAVVWEKAYG